MNIEGQSTPLSSAQHLPSLKEMMEVQKTEQRKYSLRFSSRLLEQSYHLFLLPSVRRDDAVSQYTNILLGIVMKSAMVIIAGFLLIQQMLIGIESSDLMGDDSRVVFYSLSIACLVAFKFLKFSYLQRINWVLNFYSALLLSGSFDSDSSRKEMRQLYDGMALGLCFWVQGQHVVYDGICLTICFLFIHLFKGIDGETALLSIVTAITLIILKYCSYLRDRQSFLYSYLAEYWSETALQASFVQAILFSFEKQTFYLKGTKQSSERFNQFETDKDLNEALRNMTLVNILDSPSIVQSEISSDIYKLDFKSILSNLLRNENFQKINEKERVLKGNLEYQRYQYKFTMRGVDRDFTIFMLTLALQDPKVPAKQENQQEKLSIIFLRNYRKRFQAVEQGLLKESISSNRAIQVIQRTMESLKYQTIALKNAAKKAGCVYQTLKTYSERTAASKEKQRNNQGNNDFKDEDEKLQIDIDQRIVNNFREEKKKSNQNDGEPAEIKSNQGNSNQNLRIKEENQSDKQKELDNNDIMIEMKEIVKVDIEQIPENMENKEAIQNDNLEQDKSSFNEEDQDIQPNQLSVRELILDVQKLYSDDVESTCKVSDDTRLTANSQGFRHMLFALFENCLAHNQQIQSKTNLQFTEQPFQRLITITMTIEAYQKPQKSGQEGGDDEEDSLQNQLISPERTAMNLEIHQSIMNSNNNNNPNANRNTTPIDNTLLLRYLNGINDEAVHAAEQEWFFQFLEESKCKHSQMAQSDFSQLVLQWNAEFDDTIPKEYIHEQEQEQQTHQMQQQLLKLSSDSSSFYYNIQTEDPALEQQNQQILDKQEMKINQKIELIKEQEPQSYKQGQEELSQLESRMNNNKDNPILLKDSDTGSVNHFEVTFQEKKANLFHFVQDFKSQHEESISQQDNLKLKQDSIFIGEKLRATIKAQSDQEKQEQNDKAQSNNNKIEGGKDQEEDDDDEDGDLQYFSSNNEEFFSETQSKGEKKEITQGIAAYNPKFKSIQDCPH